MVSGLVKASSPKLFITLLVAKLMHRRRFRCYPLIGLVIFLGLMTTYFVELFSGETVEITDVSSISNILPNGTEVSLTFEAEKINVFTTDGNTSLTKGVVDDAHA